MSLCPAVMNQFVEKDNLHPRSLHRGRYDFPKLIAASPELGRFVAVNPYGDESVDFADPAAVKALNRALLIQMYGIKDWDIPNQYLCPPIPSRADHLHYLADLLAESNDAVVPRGDAVRVMDVGVGANCIYPLIGRSVYGWQFVGTDIDAAALNNAQALLQANGMDKAVELRLQHSRTAVFAGVTDAHEHFDLSMCNPPFHASLGEAKAGSQRKWHNLGKTGEADPVLNFGGQGRELWCKGGEVAFVRRMIQESVSGHGNVLWFTTLVSKSDNMPVLEALLKEAGVRDTRVLEMSQGQKKSRILAWSYFDAAQRRDWAIRRWQVR